MRRQLSLGAAAVTATVLIAFLVPLAFAVQALAAAGPMNEAEQVARSLATVVALTGDTQDLEASLASAQAGTQATLTIFLPDGSTLGAPAARDESVEAAFGGASFATDADGGRAVLVVAQSTTRGTAVVRAFVPDGVLRAGVGQSWLLLAGLAIVLLVVAVIVADWLARTIVRPVSDVADAARRLAGGDLGARAQPGGPPEVEEVAGALNHLAGRITDLLAAEREMVADLSHRLRTPLTALRINAEAVRDETDRRRLLADLDAVEATVTALIHEARAPQRGGDSSTIDLCQSVRERAEYWGALADEQGRSWSLDVADEPLLVRMPAADATALVDVLIDNVFSHTADSVAYAVRCSPIGIVVEDAGEGFADAAATRRGHSAGGSTGLGLDIVRQIARAAGGEVVLGRSERGGARVEVRLAAAGSGR
jgi:signal transduction histidine kinase